MGTVNPAYAKLFKYWTTGEGGIAKIRWNTPGDYTRCVLELSKYDGEQAKGQCAKMHKLMTGNWPGSDLNRVTSGKPPRGKVIGPG